MSASNVEFSIFLSSCSILCFLCFLFLPFHCLRISVPFLDTRHYLQNIVFPEFSFNSKVLFPFHLSPRLFAFSGGIFFSLSFFLATASARWRPLIVGTRYCSIGRPPSSCLLLPLAANFLYCQSNLTFSSALYFPKFQFIITFSRLSIIYL